MDIPNDDQRMLSNVPFDPYRQKNGLYSLSTTTASSYGTMINYNMNNPYDPHAYQQQQNSYFINSDIIQLSQWGQHDYTLDPNGIIV
ncbi:unnamed protein product [Rotaria sordida]|uniref:Uncharacterized protein n=1 Tax=Rotaria sordida TaxID=392033 RepID=A0A819MVP3_9BILA|nr:unnamed protein product [Rotaria sordida]CAF3950129.1 unnamed protein product [Rotaria sordida]CAF3985943.1 unnamed protein product [Rotaria sordida]